MKSKSILLLLSILIFFALVICNIQKIRGECEKFVEDTNEIIRNFGVENVKTINRFNGPRVLYTPSNSSIKTTNSTSQGS